MTLLSARSFGVVWENISGQTALRQQLYNEVDDPGIRLAYLGIKDHNKKHLPGSVDEAMLVYEERVRKTLEVLENQNPGLEIKMTKVDFKGYQISCIPQSFCRNSNLMNAMKQSLDAVENVKINGDSFRTVSAIGDNYIDGYKKAKAIANFPDYKNGANFYQFLDEKLKEAIKQATGKEVDKIDPYDLHFLKNLEQQISDYRSGKLNRVDPKFLPLINVLDNLMEIPFEASHNLGEQLTKALGVDNDSQKVKGYQISTALSGDDLFIVIKDKDNNIIRVIGSDARGLGVSNMVTRLQEAVSFYKKKTSLTSNQQSNEISTYAIHRADELMESSMKRFQEILTRKISIAPDHFDLDEIIHQAHHDYFEEASTKNKNLMLLRNAAITDCIPSSSINHNKCIMNKIGSIHNLLKELESRGVDAHFGDSCMGVLYWLKKYGMIARKIE